MSLESVFKLSLIMNMIDNLSGPMAGVASKVGANVSKLDAASQTFGSMAKAGAAMQETGSQIVNAVLAPVEATFETRRALGELASLGVQDLEAVENAARSFSDQWAGTSKADFISAAYDIKSGIASLSDEGVAEFTSLAALTAKATKSTAGEMTSLFATGYGIYKDYYSDLSDMEFGEMFSAGISDAVRAFKTSGSGMAQAIQNSAHRRPRRRCRWKSSSPSWVCCKQRWAARKRARNTKPSSAAPPRAARNWGSSSQTPTTSS